jgi:hypothetical protein
LSSDIDDFIKNFYETGEGEHHITLDELAKQECRTKQEHQEKIVVPALQRIGIDDEILPALSKALKYPGEY